MKKLILLLLMTVPAYGQLAQWQRTVFTAGGKPAIQATVTVCAESDTSCVTPITVYSSATGAAKGNPFQTDIVGNYSFYQKTGYVTVKEAYQGASYIYQALLADPAHNIKFAEQCIGSAWGAKVNACDALLGSDCGEIWVSTNAGTTAPSTDVSLGTCHVLRFIQGGTYALGTHSILLSSRSGIVTPYSIRGSAAGAADAGVVFTYTGTGTAIAPAMPTALTYDVVLKGFVLQGTSSASGGLNMQAANSWSVADIAFINFDKLNAVPLWLHSESLAQQGTYWNTFSNLYFSNVDSCIFLSSDNLTHAPNANYFGGVTECNPIRTGVYIQQGAETVFDYLAINQSPTCTYGYKDHGRSNWVRFGRLEQAPGAGTCTAIIYDRQEGNNSNGLLNRYSGTIGNYPTYVQEITLLSGTVTGTPSNQIDYIGGQGFLSVDYNGGVGGGAFGLADAVKTFTIASGKGSASTEMARIYLGDVSTNTAKFCYRSGAADTCNVTVKGDGTLTGDTVVASSGVFKGAAVADIYANGANRLEIATAGTYPYADNTYDSGIDGFTWKVSRSYENRNPRFNITLANGANSDIVRGTSTFLKFVGPSAGFSISGFAGGGDGAILRVYNSTAQQMTITNDATSTAANRILTLTGADVVLRAGQSAATFQYDSAQSRWILMGTN